MTAAAPDGSGYCADRGGRMLAARIEPKNVLTAMPPRSHGNITNEANDRCSGIFSNEAIRSLTLIVAAHSRPQRRRPIASMMPIGARMASLLARDHERLIAL